MIPLRDNIESHSTPVVNYAIIAACAVVWLLQWNDGSGIIDRFSMIPQRVTDPDEPVYDLVRDQFTGRFVRGEERASPPFTPWLTLLTCIFLHGSWLHFLGNMWFLYIFGDNVEDRLGHLGYLGFYLASGVLASAAHLVTNLDSTMPTVGASGAIAGVMGGYFLLFPRATVLTLVPIFYFIHLMALPAFVFLGIWFLFQFVQGTIELSAVDQQTGGVAFWAHIGGFVVGAGIVWGLKTSGWIRGDIQVVTGSGLRRVRRRGW